ncbi:OmpA family protein [Rhodanobacter sp. C01]|uniref:OmpA family protein n=1 Tax=Rhodanobacter sp. C01 TaxID=1945856 RepID=UPI00143CBAC9|nr:OmpA family protein [Rhodanobacter sp. C01]
MNLSADAVFAFGKSDIASISDEGRDQLDRLVARLQRIRDVRAVHLIGYTDRIGSDGYNDTLSRRRAEAVRSYLVAHGVSDAMITTEGRGAADPLVACPDLSGSRLRACLAPNRRVAVSIVAMRHIER